jgi:hypothetical protein
MMGDKTWTTDTYYYPVLDNFNEEIPEYDR